MTFHACSTTRPVIGPGWFRFTDDGLPGFLIGFYTIPPPTTRIALGRFRYRLRTRLIRYRNRPNTPS